SADQGYARAQYALGYCYFHGLGVSQDSAESVRWLRRAANQGDAAAENRLGYMYVRGDGAPRDYVEAAHWLRKAAEQGGPEAQRDLADAYRWGRGAPQNYAEAGSWYRKAAEQGDAASEFYLGYAYYVGQGVPRNYIQALRWGLKAAAQILLRCVRRLGWSTLVTILLNLVVLAVPERRWGRARWLSLALTSAACAAYVIHVLSRSGWSGLANVLTIALFGMLSILYLIGAVRDRRRDVD